MVVVKESVTIARCIGIAFAVREKASCTGNRLAPAVAHDNQRIPTSYNGVLEGATISAANA